MIHSTPRVIRAKADFLEDDAEELTEPAIRALVKSRLSRLMPNASSALMVEEMEVCSGRARVDFAVIGDELIGIEIKGPKDTVARLPRQAQAYSQCFDLVVLVVHESLCCRAKMLIPNWWGVVSGQKVGNRIRYQFQRLPEKNPHHNIEQLLALLWRNELDELLKGYLGFVSLPREPKRAVRMRLMAEVDAAELHKASLLKLRERKDWRWVSI